MSLNPSAITKLFSESPQLKQYQAHFCDSIILDIAKTIFGVTPENVEHNLRESVFNAICERFNGITINDIGLAFKTHVQQEKVYVLTRDEFIKPIQTYWNKKMIVKREMDSQLQLLQNERQKIVDAENFKREAMQAYIDSLGTGEFKGTLFQASAIMECFSDLFTVQEKIQMNNLAEQDYNKAVMDFKTDRCMFKDMFYPEVPKGLGHYRNGKEKRDWHYFLALRVVNAALNRGVNGNGYLLIED